MKIQKDFSDGLGFHAESLFITLESDRSYKMVDLQQHYLDIESHKVRDLIFNGSIIENSSFLKWLTAQLIAEDYYISLVLELLSLHEHGMFLNCFAQRTVIIVNDLFRKWVDILDTIDKDDIILVKNTDINILRRVNQQVVDRKNSTWIYFDERMLDREQVLKSELLGCYPYGGIL